MGFFDYLKIPVKERCQRCFGTGYIPSETCDDCVDCQDTCPVCKGTGRVEEVADADRR